MTNHKFRKKYRQMQLILLIHLLLWVWIIFMIVGPEWAEFGNFSTYYDFGFWNGAIAMYLLVSSPMTQISPIIYLWRHRDRMD